MKTTRKNSNVRILSRFQYHVEDCACVVCLYWKGQKRGCSLTTCCCEDIKADALANGRIERERGAMRWEK
jgi:hypothetical protein